MCSQAERDAVSKLAGMAEAEVARLKKKLQEAGEELEDALRKHTAEQQRVQVSRQATQYLYLQKDRVCSLSLSLVKMLRTRYQGVYGTVSCWCCKRDMNCAAEALCARAVGEELFE